MSVSIERMIETRQVAAMFHAALLSNPNVQLENKKAMVSFGGSSIPVVDYAKREAELFMHVHRDIVGNEDKR